MSTYTSIGSIDSTSTHGLFIVSRVEGSTKFCTIAAQSAEYDAVVSLNFLFLFGDTRSFFSREL
jgi:hypothetical protein